MNHALIFNTCNPHWSTYKRGTGGHRIASFLREQGWDIEVIDWADMWSQDELREFAKSRINNNTIFIGFSTFFGWWSENLETFTEWISNNYPDIKLVSGSQSLPKFESKVIKYFVQGYGEYAILELIRSWVGNTSSKNINFSTLFTDKRVIIANESYPAFPMKSLMVKYEDRDYLEPSDWLGLEFGRGCIFKCSFCNFPILRIKNDHSRDADDFYNNLRENYDRFGITRYTGADETFNDYSKKIIKFADVAEKLPFRPWITSYIRADLLAARPQDWEHLLRLGVTGHFYGIETMNHKTGKSIGKGSDPEKFLPKILEAKDYFLKHNNNQYRGSISLIVGLPYETPESIENSMQWLIKNWQGQNFILWPLEIPIKKTTDVLSTLSLNYEQYGYKESQIPLTFKSILFDSIKHMNNGMNWQNDYFNLQTASELSEKYTIDLIANYDFRLSAFGFDFRNYSIDEILKVRQRDLSESEMRWQGLLNHVDNYKQKKLNTSK